MFESIATVTTIFVLITLFIALVDRQTRQEIDRAMSEHLKRHHNIEHHV